MKEITRRLYTKPVMLGMALLVGVALVVGLLVTTRSTSASNTFPIAAGNDEFETAGDGETYHDFANSPIPADFFGAGSQAYSGLVPLVGVPLNPAVSQVDTIIQRHQSVAAPGGSTSLTMTGLSLASINPITVTYSGGATESWNMKVGLSNFKASTGSMTINSSTFDSTLKVWPKFTFKRVSDGLEKVLDTGGSGLTAASTASASISDGFVIEPAPEPTVAPAPCPVIDTFEGTSKVVSSDMTSATATSSCPPVTLSSVNSPWVTCANGGFCIPVPITEEERWARHRPGPKGTKRAIAVAVAE